MANNRSGSSLAADLNFKSGGGRSGGSSGGFGGDKIKLLVAVGCLVVAGAVIAWQFWPSSSGGSTPSQPTANGAASDGQPAQPPRRRNMAPGK